MDIIDRIFEVNSKKGAPGLARIGRLLDLMGNPERNFGVIHVAGTNGKGSTSHFLRSVLVEAGYRTGMFTSPHINSYNERFQVNYGMISDEDFERIADYVMSFRDILEDEGYGYPSLFEILTATAYQYFAEQGVEYMISEVGIGGRIDSTNTVKKPVCCVITQIGLDHTELLGNTLEEVASEKAGIIKCGVPVITSSIEESVETVIRAKAHEKAARVLSVNDIEYSNARYNDSGEKLMLSFDALIEGEEYKAIALSMLGEHQIRNALAAILCIRASGITVSKDSLYEGLRKAVNPGRFEILGRKPDFVIDGAHNDNGIKASIKTFRQLFGNVNNKRIIILFGCFKDKDFRGMINEVADEFRGCSFIATEPEGDRALDSDIISRILEEKGCECISIHDSLDAYHEAADRFADVIYVLGSIYLISEIRNYKRKEF